MVNLENCYASLSYWELGTGTFMCSIFFLPCLGLMIIPSRSSTLSNVQPTDDYRCPTPNAQRPTPNAQRPTPNAQRPTPKDQDWEELA